MVTYKYRKFKALYTEPFGSLEYAFHRALADIEFDFAEPIEIQDGETIYSRQDILNHFKRK
jgi:hypothetical protein